MAIYKVHIASFIRLTQSIFIFFEPLATSLDACVRVLYSHPPYGLWGKAFGEHYAGCVSNLQPTAMVNSKYHVWSHTFFPSTSARFLKPINTARPVCQTWQCSWNRRWDQLTVNKNCAQQTHTDKSKWMFVHGGAFFLLPLWHLTMHTVMFTLISANATDNFELRTEKAVFFAHSGRTPHGHSEWKNRGTPLTWQ